MKYLFHISSLYGGGAERVMSNLINFFCDSNNEVVVVVCYNHDGEYEINKKAKKITIGNYNLVKQSILLRKIIKNEKPDLCISFMQGGNIRMVLANLFTKQKYVLSVRNDPSKEYDTFFTKIFAKTMFKKSSGIVFQTPYAMNYFNKKIQNKSTVIFNPVSNDFFAPNHDNLNNEGIVSLGRLTSQKNFEFLIRTFKKIENQITDNLYIYGEGELKEKLRDIIFELELQKRVFLMGRTSGVKSILNKAKCFVMSSNFEGMPNALLESVCMLVPSISTDCPCGGARIILDNNCGILTKINDELELGNAIVKICNDLDYRNKLSNNCLKHRNQFDTKTILSEWYSFLTSKIGG